MATNPNRTVININSSKGRRPDSADYSSRRDSGGFSTNIQRTDSGPYDSNKQQPPNLPQPRQANVYIRQAKGPTPVRGSQTQTGSYKETDPETALAHGSRFLPERKSFSGFSGAHAKAAGVRENGVWNRGQEWEAVTRYQEARGVTSEIQQHGWNAGGRGGGRGGEGGGVRDNQTARRLSVGAKGVVTDSVQQFETPTANQGQFNAKTPAQFTTTTKGASPSNQGQFNANRGQSSTQAAVAASTLNGGDGVSSPPAEDDAKRPSRKSGVFVLPPHPGGYRRDIDDDDDQLSKNDSRGISLKQTSKTVTPSPQPTPLFGKRVTPSPSSAITIRVTPGSKMSEVDSGVDTDNWTPSPPSPSSYPLNPPSSSTSLSHDLTRTVIEEVEETGSTSTHCNDDNEDDNNNDGGEEEDDVDYRSSRFLSQLHPVYEKKGGSGGGALKGARRVSTEGGGSHVHPRLTHAGTPHLSGATRRISQHNRKVRPGMSSLFL